LQGSYKKPSRHKSEAKGISPTFSKLKVKLIGLFQKFRKTMQSKVNLLKILQDRRKTNVFVPNCVKEEKTKKRNFVFFGKKANKNEYNRSSTIEDLPLLIPPCLHPPHGCPPGTGRPAPFLRRSPARPSRSLPQMQEMVVSRLKTIDATVRHLVLRPAIPPS
jgi:hypothetical protein